jgi:hypothetical protein
LPDRAVRLVNMRAVLKEAVAEICAELAVAKIESISRNSPHRQRPHARSIAKVRSVIDLLQARANRGVPPLAGSRGYVAHLTPIIRVEHIEQARLADSRRPGNNGELVPDGRSEGVDTFTRQ